MNVRRNVYLITRLCLGAIFVVSGMQKLTNPYDFLIVVHKYELVGPLVASLVASVLPFFEVTLGTALLIDRMNFAASILSVVALATFLAAQASAITRGLAIPCGCFGPVTDATDTIDEWTIIRTTLYLAGGFVLLYLNAKSLQFSAPEES